MCSEHFGKFLEKQLWWAHFLFIKRELHQEYFAGNFPKFQEYLF